MPIPDPDLNHVLPPHLGDPTKQDQLSPYPASSFEVCERYATTAARIVILDGWLRFRSDLLLSGLVEGFQQLGGSFLEAIELSASRDPNDLDLVTFYRNFPPSGYPNLFARIPLITNRTEFKRVYKLDHYFVDIDFRPEVTLSQGQYWYGLFAHRRDGVWKGMLRVELDTPHDDAAARILVDSRRAQGGL